MLGTLAAISFLQFLRQLLKHHAAPSLFTEMHRMLVMVEELTPPLRRPGKMNPLRQCFSQAASSRRWGRLTSNPQ